MTFFDPFTLALSTLSITGAILVGFKKVQGFYIWVVANFSWIAINLYQGVLQDQVFMWSAFLATSIFSIYNWHKDDARSETT